MNIYLALSKCGPHAAPDFLLDAAEAMALSRGAYGLHSAEAVAAFIGQAAHETQGFTRLSENLKYTSAARIRAMWPARFESIETARIYTHSPQALANRVYANRMGNGDEASGDGWRYRGRGFFHMTGRRNYAQAEKVTGLAFLENPDLATTAEGAVLSALWFWQANGLGTLLGRGSVEALTRRINGGLNGLNERAELIELATHAL